MCKKNKKLKNLPYRFFIDALENNGKVSWEAYGADRRRLGKALLEVAKKNGFDLPKSDTNCYAMTNHLESMGVIVKVKDGFTPSETWKGKIDSLYPKESSMVVTEVVKVEGPEIQEVTAEEEKKEITPPKNFLEFYTRVLESMGTEYVSRENLRKTIENTYLEIFGHPDPKATWWFSRIWFLERNSMIEGIEDQGTTMYLRSSKYEDILKKKSSDSRLLKEFIITVVPEEKAPVVVVEEKKEEEVVIQKKEEVKERSTICVCLPKEELHKLYVAEVIYEGPVDNTVVVSIEPSQANLDVLKILPDVCVNQGDRDKLKILYREERENLIKALSRINSLTGEE